MRHRARSTAGFVALTGALLVACTGLASQAPPPAAAGGNPEHGRQLMFDYGCGSCHTIPGVPEAKGRAAPPLIAFGHRAFIAGNLPNNQENLIHWIMAPQEVEPGTAMPDLGVEETQARDIAAYLLSLQ
ncbi:MAG: c-type cytochrome [Actinomycetota bacterium]|nr:c-type cytochrome [Actinomycetota bacterium]